MKKIIAVIITVLMIIPLCIVFSSAEETNVAAGKSYEKIGVYTDAEEKTWWPDIDDAELTDGTITTIADEWGFAHEHWTGLHINGAGVDEEDNNTYIVVDLDEVKTHLTKFTFYTTNDNVVGIKKPESVEVLLSEDNENFVSAGTMSFEKIVDMYNSEIENAHEDDGLYLFTLDLDAGRSARYVKFYIDHASNWAFSSEVEVYQDLDADEYEEEEEVIELDGILDDTGWTEDGWTNVNSENGKWQTPVDDPDTEDEETRDENYDFQFRTDDETCI